MDVRKTAVLVVNASFEPLSFCSGRRALTLLVKDVAVVEVEGDQKVHATMTLPSVIRLKKYHFIPPRMQEVSRKNILLRDRNICQYCGVKFHPSELTLDHVMPRSRGGGNSWVNLVTCCQACNRKKADRTPEEAGMALLHKPRSNGVHTARFLLRSMGAENESWAPYLYTSSDKRFETTH